MIQNDDFIKRLEVLLDYYTLNASTFADKIGVQRSSVSHLLSGRNKPSLDFILKIISVFPEVDLYWILLDQGEFQKSERTANAIPTPTKSTIPEAPSVKKPTPLPQPTLFSQTEPTLPSNQSQEKKITRVVVFYSDGTFSAHDEAIN